MSSTKEIFAIQDNEGRYVDQDSIFYDEDKGRCIYTSEENYYGYVNLYNNKEKAEQVIAELNDKLHNIGESIYKSFFIKNIR